MKLIPIPGSNRCVNLDNICTVLPYIKDNVNYLVLRMANRRKVTLKGAAADKIATELESVSGCHIVFRRKHWPLLSEA